MNDLAEIVVYLPLKGATVPYFVERFVEPSLAFAAGWNYWYAYAILVAGTSSLLRSSQLSEMVFLPFLRLWDRFGKGASALLLPRSLNMLYAARWLT